MSERSRRAIIRSVSASDPSPGRVSEKRTGTRRPSLVTAIETNSCGGLLRPKFLLLLQ
ncbi:MAG: hypothetical protein M3301_00275 [Chloroflexota bacterium]|nr:hypothetical protein [Chloroflexota bacterium]